MAIHELGTPPRLPDDRVLRAKLQGLRRYTARPGWHIGHVIEVRVKWYGFIPCRVQQDLWRVLLEVNPTECRLMFATEDRDALIAYLDGAQSAVLAKTFGAAMGTAQSREAVS